MAQLQGDSIRINRQYLDSLLVESRIIGAERTSTRFEFLGHTFETPIMTAALSHVDLVAMAEGARLAGAPVSIGMGDNEEMGRVLDTGAQVMKIIKPYADPEQILSRIRYAEEHGAAAVGMDVEHAVNVEDPEDSVILGMPMKLPTMEELRSYVRATRLPFFVKGAAGPRDAERCLDIGCAGIILSHHNGLMRYAVPPVMALAGIRKAVGDRLLVIVDGGIETGFDAFKALAMGADAVTVGKALMPAIKEGAESVRETLEKLTKQLQAMMLRTGSPDLKHIDPAVIRPMPFALQDSI